MGTNQKPGAPPMMQFGSNAPVGKDKNPNALPPLAKGGLTTPSQPGMAYQNMLKGPRSNITPKGYNKNT
jgi:hypothetical protein